MNIKWLTSLLKHSVTSYELPRLIKRRKYKSQNSIRKNIINSRNLQLNELNKFHKSYLFEQYNKNRTHLFLTNTNQNDSIDVEDKKKPKEKLNRKRLLNSSSIPFNNKMCFQKNAKSPLQMYFSDIGLNRNSEYLCENESTNSLIFKTKNLMKNNLVKTFQEDQLSNLLEFKNQKNLEYDLKMFNCKNDYKLLLHFLFNQINYIRYLNGTIKEEKNLLLEIEEKEQVLDKEIKHLKEIIKKKQNFVNKALEYKEFLLQVKYRVTNIKEIPKEELKKYGYNIHKISNSPKDTIQIENLKLIDKKLSLNPRKRSSIFRFYSKNSKPKSFIEVINHVSIPIFYNTDEFDDHLRRIEKHTFQLFSQYSKQSEKIVALKKKKKNLSLTDKIETDSYYSSKLFEEKNQLIKENFRLKNDLNMLSHSMNKKHIEHKLLTKLKEILLNLPINIEKEFEENNFYHLINDQTKDIWFNGRKYNMLVYMIKILERILLFFILKIKHLNENPYIKPIIQRSRMNIEKKKRLINNKKNREADIEKRKNTHLQIIKKNQKLNWKTKRKPDLSIPHRKNLSKDYDRLKGDLQEEFENLLTY